MSDDSDSLWFSLPKCMLDFECIESLSLSYVARGDLSAETSLRLSNVVEEGVDNEERLEPLPTAVVDSINSADALIMSGCGSRQIKIYQSPDDKVFMCGGRRKCR